MTAGPAMVDHPPDPLSALRDGGGTADRADPAGAARRRRPGWSRPRVRSSRRSRRSLVWSSGCGLPPVVSDRKCEAWDGTSPGSGHASARPAGHRETRRGADFEPLRKNRNTPSISSGGRLTARERDSFAKYANNTKAFRCSDMTWRPGESEGRIGSIGSLAGGRADPGSWLSRTDAIPGRWAISRVPDPGSPPGERGAQVDRPLLAP